MKKCACCGAVKSLDDFCRDKHRPDGRLCYCKSCQADKRKLVPREIAQAYQNTWRSKNIAKLRDYNLRRYRANPEARRASAKRWRDKHRQQLAKKWSVHRRGVTLAAYGLTPTAYDIILVSQNHACAICKSADPKHWSGRFQIDHDHETNAVRGLLCSSCNGGLGLFRDNAENLLEAVRYLTRAAEVSVQERERGIQ